MKHFNLACFEVSKFQNDIVHVGGKEKDHWTTRAKVRLLNRCLDPSLNELHERPVMKLNRKIELGFMKLYA